MSYSKDMCPKTQHDINYMKNIPYSNVVGSLLYLSITCRPDISYIVSVLSRFMQNPGIQHWEGIKKILRYLKGTTNLGITYGGNKFTHGDTKNVLSMFTDSDWAACEDTRRSLSAYVIVLNGGPIQWKCKYQSIIAQSSTEAEYISVANACNELTWICRLMSFLCYSQKCVDVYIDNRSAISIASNQKDDRRTRHIDVKYHLIKKLVADKQIRLHHIPGSSNPADMLTKPETNVMFLNMRRLLMTR